jgi:hypothetical protein
MELPNAEFIPHAFLRSSGYAAKLTLSKPESGEGERSAQLVNVADREHGAVKTVSAVNGVEIGVDLIRDSIAEEEFSIQVGAMPRRSQDLCGVKKAAYSFKAPGEPIWKLRSRNDGDW